MLFSSLTFIFVLLPLTVMIYYLLEILKTRRKIMVQNLFLIGVSLVFFAWDNVDHVKVLLLLIFFNYVMGLWAGRWRRAALIGVAGNIVVLAYYKYMDMFIDTINRFLAGRVDSVAILAPLGISFIIFHCISYMMDVYQETARPCLSLSDLALYITFFPKLTQGPIVKYKDMAPFFRKREPDLDGIQRFLIGLGKKALLADTLALTADDIFGLLGSGMDVPTAWLGSICFTLQIYLDFSGYSDMAIGLGRIFGFRFKENFDFPYRSQSVTEFWRRWHMSLGAAFRDYLYIPLGGNRKGNVYVNLFIVFLVTGIWHGASWIFIAWGIGHGVCVLFERYASQKTVWYARIPSPVKWLGTMLVVNFGWVCFKVGSFDELLRYLGHMFGIGGGNETYSFSYFVTPRLMFLVIVSVFGIAFLGNKKIQNRLREWQEGSVLFNAAACVFILIVTVCSLMAIVSTNYSPFLYFQF